MYGDKISLDDAILEVKSDVEEAIDFMHTEFAADWEEAELYAQGGSSIPTEYGRSQVVKTVVRDLIRAAMPSIMRTLYHARKPVEYKAKHFEQADFVDAQAIHARELFLQSGGYLMLYSAVHESLKLKGGPMKCYWEENPTPTYMHFTGVTAEEIEELKAIQEIVIEDISKKEIVDEIAENFPDLYDVKARHYRYNGNIRMESFPIYEFFVSRNAKTVQNAKVHGHFREVTVDEAISMGIDYKDWESLDGDNPEEGTATGVSTERRGYSVDQSESETVDIMKKRFILYEAYCEFDLKGTGRLQKYVFYLGGTAKVYLGHQEIEDYCIDLISVDPQGFTVMGNSLADALMSSQDNSTSLLRAVMDNAHLANNPRHAADPSTTDFNDLMNNVLGAPIKTRGQPAIQTVTTPSIAQSTLPVLAYLDQDAEMKVGITKASQGLDPDAMQSTDKDAVRNTIALSQGQIELMVRNIIETGLIPIFRKVLRMSVRHMDRIQIVHVKGVPLPLDVSMFDPELPAEPTVGLGAGSPEQKMAFLQMILGKQEQFMQAMGPTNPFVGFSHIYNTLEEMATIAGFSNPNMFFKPVTPAIEKAYYADKQREQQEAAQAAAQNKSAEKMPAEQIYLQVEAEKGQINKYRVDQEQATKRMQIEADKEAKKREDDFRRDQMVQQAVIKLKEMGSQRSIDIAKQISDLHKEEVNGPDNPEEASADVRSTLAAGTGAAGQGLQGPPQ